MKKNIIYLSLIVLTFVMLPNNAMAAKKAPKHAPVETNEMPAEIRVMVDRLSEIKGMTTSSLNRSKKKELRKEVRAIKKSVRASGNGIYISSGAIIIILLLIIIL